MQVMNNPDSDRGRRASIDADGSVHGSGSGAGGGNPGEDYDDDSAAGSEAPPTGAGTPSKVDTPPDSSAAR